MTQNGTERDYILKTEKLSVWYGTKKAVNEVSLKVDDRSVTAIIGPSGCGKSTFLRSLNRMNDFVEGLRIEGKAIYKDVDIYARKTDPVVIRRKVGMVFQKPNPFPKSIFQNIVWGPRINGFKVDENELVEKSLRRAALWDEVKDRLGDSALALSGGQQQRLCIARAIAMDPELILMDEPCSALDPRATTRIEELIKELRRKYSIMIVTHNMQQAARVSDKTAFLYEGDLIEFGETQEMFTKPAEQQTEDYITGRFG